MILSGREILKQLNTNIFIEPFEESRLNPNSYNLTLADELLVYENMRVSVNYHFSLRYSKSLYIILG